MSNIAENIGNFGIWEGTKETIADLFGQGTKQTPAQFKVTDDNGDTSEVSNAAATPFYKTPTGYSNTRSYAYLTQGDDGKLTLNVSKDLYDSDTFKEQYLDNYTFKNVLKAYNANQNANTVVTTTDADGNTENKTFRQVVDDYNKALGEFASGYEGYSLLRDDIRNNTGFELSDAEIRIASNSIGKDDKKSETSVIYLPDEWMNIYDFTKMDSFDKDTKTVSAKDFFDAYNLDKEGGINEEAWNEMTSSANSVVANAYSGNMKKNVDEDAGGSEEATAKAKDRLVRAYQASNLLAKHDPEQSFLHTAGIVASNTVLSFSDNVTNLLNNVGYLEAYSIEGYHAAIDYGVAYVKDALSFNVMLQGAASEDLESGAVTPYNYNEYIDGILVASTDGSLSEFERVKAEWDAKVSSGNTLYQLAADKDFNKMLQFKEAAEGQIDYTSRIAPAAARAGELMGEGIFIAVEIYLANVSGQGVGAAVESAAAEGALATAFAKGTPLLTRLTSLANAALTNKFVSFNANMTTQALIDTIAFEDTETLNAAMANMDPGAIATLNNAFADNFVGNTVAEVSGVFGSAVGDKINSSKNPVVRYVNSRAIKVANAISLPKKKAQMKFANTKLARFLSRPLGKGTAAAADFAVKAMTEMDGAVFKAGNLEEFNIEKARMEYEATKNVAKAKAGQQYVVDYETNATKMAATTTEAIFGKAGEKKNLLNQASRIAEGIKSYTQEMLADESIRTTWEGLTNEANNLNNVLKWSEYNPAAGRFLSQDASNYVINKAHYDDLLEKQRLKLLKEETLSAAEAKKLNELKEWLHNFSMRYSPDAITALNKFIDSDRALNKALTDWQVRHGVMSKAQYESLAGVGYYGENDERYIRAIALPEGKTMDSVLSEEYETFAIGTDRQFLENVGKTTGVRDVNTMFDQDLHLSNKTDSNYLDPVLTNAMTISSIAKAYQGKMWGNALMSVKAVTNTVDMTGKPASKTEINAVIKKAGEAASTAISKASFDDLVPDDVESIGKAYVESRTDYTVERTDKKGKTTKENKNKVEEAQKAVNKKLGIADDAQVITRTNSLDVDQTKNVLATFGTDAPTYGKVRTNAELKAQFEALSPKQQEQALEAMGSKAIKTTKTYKTEVPNPEHAEWVKEKKAFNDEQKALKAKFDEEQKALKAEYGVKKKAYDEYVKKTKAQAKASTDSIPDSVFDDFNDAAIDKYQFDVKDGQELDMEDAIAAVSEERADAVSGVLKKGIDKKQFIEDARKFLNEVDGVKTNNAKYKEARKKFVDKYADPEYLSKVRGDSSAVEEIAKVEDPGKFEKKKFEAKTFDKPEPEKKLTEKKTKEEYSGVKALEEPGALRAWNKAVDNTDMVDSLNKTFIQERVNPAEGGPKKMSAGTRETLEAYIAENSLRSWSPELMTEAELKDSFTKQQKLEAKARSYDEAVQKLEDAKEMARMVEEGTDPFTRTIEVIGEESILGGIDEIKRPFKDGTNAVADSIKMKAEQYGIMDDSAYRYYALSGMVEIKSDGTTGISKKYENAFRKKYGDRLDNAIRKEGKIYNSQKKALLDEAVKKLNDYVSSEWRKSQAFLISQGATDLIDTEKMFESVRGELSQILDDVTKNRNIIQVLDADGEYKFVEVDPLVADLYRSRPYTIRGNESFIRKTSRLARLGNTTFNIKSYLVNQTFKDAIQSVIMAGTAHTIKTYSKEVAEMFGEECVKYLQESMGEAGWDKFAEGLTEKEAREKAADLLITGGLGSKSYAGELTQSKLYQSGNKGPQSSGEDVVSQIRGLTSQGYMQSGWTKNKGLAAGKEAKKGVIGWLEDHSIGNKVNNIRETTLRQANYAAAFNDALRGGQTVAQARATAEFVSRNATTNFQNTFMWGNWICDNVPFLSAAINGSASFWRLFEMDPLGVLTRLNSVGLYVMAQTISSGQTLEDRKTLSNVPDYVKDDNSVFIYGGQVYKIPLPEEVAKFLSPYRQAAEKMLGSENRSWVELLYNDALNISPISLDGFSTEDQTALTKNEGLMSRLNREVQVLISQVSPPIVQTAIMAVTGVDPYTGNEIDTSYVYYDEDGNRQIVNYKAGEAARALAQVSDKFNWGISADAAEALLEKFLGTGGLNFVDGLMRLGEAFTGADVEGNKISAGEALLKIPEAEATRAASSVTVSEYSIKDKYDRDFKKIIKDLTAEKNKMLTPGSKYLDNVSQLSQLKVTDNNYETKKKNLTQSTMQDIEDFRTKAMNLVNTYVAHNGSDYDDKKFASVVALLNFNQQTTMPTTALDFQRAHQDYYDGRQDAYQTMVDLGFSSTNDLSIFGLAKRNKNTGEVYTKYISPVAILNAGATIGSNMAETVNAEIAAALEVSGIDRSAMFEGYYAAKAQGSAAAKQYKKDWNAKVVKAIAPTVYQYGADTILGNSTVQDYLDNYLFISNPYKTEDYLKEIFEVEDK